MEVRVGEMGFITTVIEHKNSQRLKNQVMQRGKVSTYDVMSNICRIVTYI